MDLKNKIQLYAVYKSHFRYKDMHRLNMKGWKKISHENCNQKRVGCSYLYQIHRLKIHVKNYQIHRLKLHKSKLSQET